MPPFCIPGTNQCARVLMASRPPQHLVLLSFSVLALWVGGIVLFHSGFKSPFSDERCWAPFLVLLARQVSSFVSCLFKLFTHVIGLASYGIWKVLHIFQVQVLCQSVFCVHLLPDCVLLIHVLTGDSRAENFSFDDVRFRILFCSGAFCVLLANLCLLLGCGCIETFLCVLLKTL